MIVEETPQAAGCVWWWISRCFDEIGMYLPDVFNSFYHESEWGLSDVSSSNHNQMIAWKYTWKHAKMWHYEKSFNAVGVICHVGMLWKVWVWTSYWFCKQIRNKHNRNSVFSVMGRAGIVAILGLGSSIQKRFIITLWNQIFLAYEQPLLMSVKYITYLKQIRLN